MPRDVHAWSGKPLAPPLEPTLRAPIAPPAPPVSTQAISEPVAGSAPRPPTVACPRCGGALRSLASGALGCTECAEIFQARTNAPPPFPQEPESAALDQIDAINAMLRRNTLVLGPGGVPLAENSDNDSRGSRRRAAKQRRARR